MFSIDFFWNCVYVLFSFDECFLCYVKPSLFELLVLEYLCDRMENGLFSFDRGPSLFVVTASDVNMNWFYCYVVLVFAVSPIEGPFCPTKQAKEKEH